MDTLSTHPSLTAPPNRLPSPKQSAVFSQSKLRLLCVLPHTRHPRLPPTQKKRFSWSPTRESVFVLGSLALRMTLNLWPSEAFLLLSVEPRASWCQGSTDGSAAPFPQKEEAALAAAHSGLACKLFGLLRACVSLQKQSRTARIAWQKDQLLHLIWLQSAERMTKSWLSSSFFAGKETGGKPAPWQRGKLVTFRAIMWLQLTLSRQKSMSVDVFSNYLLLKVNCHNKMPVTWHRREKKFTSDYGLRDYNAAMVLSFLWNTLLLTPYFPLSLSIFLFRSFIWVP